MNACTSFHNDVSEDEKIKALGQGLMGPLLTHLSANNQKKALSCEYKALEYGQEKQAMKWSAFLDKAQGYVVAGKRYQVGKEVCRQYTHKFTIDKRHYTVKGSACRNEDGSWNLLN